MSVSQFIVDDLFDSSYKMGVVKTSLEKMQAKFGDGEYDCDGKVNFHWGGFFTISGKKCRASVWCWKGSLEYCGEASVWVSDPSLLSDFIGFIKAA